MNIVVAGCGKIGKAIVGSLAAEKHNITVIDEIESVVSGIANMYDVMSVAGNCVDYDILTEAAVDKADLFVAVTASDEVNMLSCFIAKKMGAKNTMARIRNPEYSEKDLTFMTKNLELSKIINPELSSAQQIFNIVKFPSAMKIETFSTRKFEMIEMRLKSNSALDGMTLRELRSKYKAMVLICVVQRDEYTVIPNGNFALKSGDRIEIAAAPSEIQKFLKELGVFQKQARNIMVIGGGRISRYLTEMLTGIGNDVKVLEIDKKICEDFSVWNEKADVVEADGAKHDVLVEEGIDRTEAFIALTGIDEENILVSKFAQQKNVPTVITKVNDENLVVMAEKLGIDCIVTPAQIIADRVIQYVRALDHPLGSTVKTVYQIMDGQAEALEFTAKLDSKCVNIPLKHLPTRDNILLVGLIRDKRTIIPSGEDEIMPDDVVIVVSKSHGISKLDDIMKW